MKFMVRIITGIYSVDREPFAWFVDEQRFSEIIPYCGVA